MGISIFFLEFVIHKKLLAYPIFTKKKWNFIHFFSETIDNEIFLRFIKFYNRNPP